MPPQPKRHRYGESFGLSAGRSGESKADPKQKWKLPVKYWIHELYFKRFGCVLGEKPLPEPQPQPERIEYDEEAIRLYGEQLYWEEYQERNAETRSERRRPVARSAPQRERAESACPGDCSQITDDDVPF